MKLCKKHNQSLEYACLQCKKKYCKACMLERVQCLNHEHQFLYYSKYLELKQLEKEKKLVFQIEKMKENTSGLTEQFTVMRKRQYKIDVEENKQLDLLMNQLRSLICYIKESHIKERIKWMTITKKIRSYQKRNMKIEKKVSKKTENHEPSKGENLKSIEKILEFESSLFILVQKEISSFHLQEKEKLVNIEKENHELRQQASSINEKEYFNYLSNKIVSKYYNSDIKNSFIDIVHEMMKNSYEYYQSRFSLAENSLSNLKKFNLIQYIVKKHQNKFYEISSSQKTKSKLHHQFKKALYDLNSIHSKNIQLSKYSKYQHIAKCQRKYKSLLDSKNVSVIKHFKILLNKSRKFIKFKMQSSNLPNVEILKKKIGAINNYFNLSQSGKDVLTEWNRNTYHFFSPKNKNNINYESQAHYSDYLFYLQEGNPMYFNLFDLKTKQKYHIPLYNNGTWCNDLEEHMGFIFTGGGWTGSGLKTCILIDPHNLNNSPTKKIADLNNVTSHASIVSTPSGLILLGGYLGHCINLSESYDVKNDKWTQLKGLNNADCCINVTYFSSNFIYTFGGYSQSQFERKDLSPVDNAWELLNI